MRIIVEEIIRAHPSGAKAGGFLRVERARSEIDSAAATLIGDNDSIELWLGRHRRCVNILTHRVTVLDDGVGLIVDVAEEEIVKEILPRYDRSSALDEGAYIAWAKKNEVWP